MSEPLIDRPQFPEDYGIPQTLEGVLPWSHVLQRLESALNYWVATVDPHGHPHVTPIWGVLVAGELYFDGSPQTRRGRNISQNSAVVVHLESGTDVVILHGEARQLNSAPLELRQVLAAVYTAKYQHLGYTADPAVWVKGGLYRLHLRRAFAWTSFPQDVTRWRFAED